MISTFKLKRKKLFNKIIDKALDLLIKLEDLKLSDDEDYNEEVEDDLEGFDEELDLEPIKDFMEEYIGHIIVDISGNKDYSDLNDKIKASMITAISLDGDNLKFKLSKLNGESNGFMCLSPTKHGMFTEKFSTDGLSLNTIYRISFYGGYSLEYLDSKEKGAIFYQDKK